MSDAVKFLKIIKQAAVEAVNAMKPVEVCFGKVTSISPFEITVNQKMTLGKEQLVFTRNVTEYKVDITAEDIQDYYYEGGSPDTMEKPLPKRFRAVRRMPFIVHNGLDVGEEVLLLRQQGGQKYIIWDRIE